MLKSLNALLCSDDDRAICLLALNADEVISVRRFRADIARVRQQVERVEASTWLLYAESTYSFALGFFALLGLKKSVLICASNKASWVEQFDHQFEAVLSDSSLVVPGKFHVALPSESARSEPCCEAWAPVFDGAEEVSFFTSGSTGEPKRIRKELNLLLREVQTLDNSFGDSMGQALFAASVSHHHIYGLLFKLLWPLLTNRMWLDRQVDYPEQLLNAAQSGKEIVFVSSPGLLSHLDVTLAVVEATCVFSSGGPLSYAAAVDAQTWLTKLPIEIYGSTETGGIAFRQQASIDEGWTLFPELRLQQAENQMELFSPYLPAGGPIALDDIILIDPEGTFTLRGRRDRVVKIAEKRVSLTGIEHRAESLKTIERCIALSLQDGRQTIGCAVVLSNAGRSFLTDHGITSLVKLWKEEMATYFDRVVVPKKWRVLQCLPVNTQGKIDTAFIAELFMARKSVGIDLPTVSGVSLLDRGVDLDLTVESGLNVFDGHFTNAPIVPGVVQIKWAIELSRQYLAHLMPAGPETLISVKFQNVIHPGQQIKMSLVIMNDRLDFVVSSGRGRHSSGKIALT